ncbi:DUF342 domain-containing protein [Psychrobium sp. 1_MG-2023]|uniref:DUF342 domain-containing protein n=1 Tax=Psychrobium sp. 1_MG-2023 TaxID=3062624 RepID=UPI000C34E9F2|nr:FapA family protein [Psychrobium sp. 1_MG-2023]MDP2562174.1 FapA family protein [Psychrobium sp. 1_MG-2023]PKF58122.1 hypothetical protein CW748_04795 [Alteromonadales bacterium alter-6D02]
MLSPQSIRLSSDGMEMLITVEPQSNAIRAVEICQLLNRSDSSQFFQVEENIALAADLINKCTKEASLPEEQQTCAELGTEIIVSQKRHATLTIELSADEMQAYAVINAPYGGTYIDFSDLMTTLTQYNIVQGVKNDTLDEFLNASHQANPGDVTKHHIASGTPPINGQDSTFEMLVETMEQRSLKPQAKSNGKVDMKELGDILTVKEAARLMRRHLPTEGTPGINVLGESIAPQPGVLHEFSIGEGTEVSSTDENLLIANRVGIPRAIDNGLVIDDILTVDNVDVGFGNINFEGSVMISGDVCEGLKVVSQGDITVGGSVNSATLEAKGNITVQHGISGHKSKVKGQYTCNITAGGNIHAQYIQYGKIEAGGNLNVQTQMLHSNATVTGSVTVCNKAQNKGTLFGGVIQAGTAISAVEIGGNSGSKTLLSIRGPFNTIRGQKNELNKDLHTEYELLKQLIEAYDKLAELNCEKEHKKLLSQLKKNVDQKVVTIIQLQNAISHLDEQLDLRLTQASILSSKTLHEGVQLNIDKLHLTTYKNYSSSKTQIKDGEIQLGPLS